MGWLLDLLILVFVSSVSLLVVKASLALDAPRPAAIAVGLIVGALLIHYAVKLTAPPAAERD